MNKRIYNHHGFTLIEIVIGILIAGILATVALRSLKPITETARIEETKEEMRDLTFAIAGNPQLENNGTRTDFGYVGDIGSLPPNLDALIANPGGYGTWNGPYINSRFVQSGNDYKNDAWSTPYQFSNADLVSTGSGSSIVRKIANSTNSLINNQISGSIVDLNGAAPGTVFSDSLMVVLVHPDGTGSYSTRTSAVQPSGAFTFASVPIGNHDLTAVYLPTTDSLKRFCSVIPESAPHILFKFDTAYFSPASGGSGGSGLVYVGGSAVTGGGQCNDFSFAIFNPTASDIVVTTINVSWSSPLAYYRAVDWDGSSAFSRSNPRVASTETITFDSPATVSAGTTITIALGDFKQNPTGGSNVDMSNVDFTVEFSDGSIISFNSGGC